MPRRRPRVRIPSLAQKITSMEINLEKVITNTFRDYGDEVPPSLVVRRVVCGINMAHPDLSEIGRLELAMRSLRLDYGYHDGCEDAADKQEETTARVALKVLAQSKVQIKPDRWSLV